MKLYGAAASPFVRKVRVAIIECGLGPKVEQIDTDVAPTAANDRVNENNPLGKIPTLVTDDGLGLFDSRVIAEYLDSLVNGVVLFPKVGATGRGPLVRWRGPRQKAMLW